MEGIKIKCPNCREICFETTEKFRPDVTVNGSMVRKLPRITWHIDWLCSDVTPAAQMTCPMCDVGQLAPSGRLLLVDPPPMNVLTQEQKHSALEYVNKRTEEFFNDTEPVPTPDEPITTPFTSDGNSAPMEALVEKVNDATEKAIDFLNAPNPLICDVCGKECKNQLGLKSHKRSHKK